MDYSANRGKSGSVRSLVKSPRVPAAKSTSDASHPEDFLLTRADVQAAFNFFDTDKKGDLKPRDLKQRLSAFYPEMTNKEFKFLLGDSTESGGNFTAESLWHIIDHSQKTQAKWAADAAAASFHFDPVREAFSIYDPHGTGVVEVEVLASIMKRIGFGDLSQEEADLLVRTADFDRDGKINLDDFRNLLKIGR